MSARFHQWGTLLATGIGALFVGIDFTVVNTVLGNIQASLHTSLPQLQWVMAGFALTFCTLMVTMGRLGDLIGRRLLLYIGIIGFMLSSLGSGLSHTALQLILCRVLQGLFSAIIFPCGMALTSKAFPRDQQGKAVGLYSSLVGIGFAIGPVLGGFLVSIASWRWIFLINFPVGIISLIICFFAVLESRSEKEETIDWWGMSLLIIGLGTAVFAIMEGTSLGWGSLPVLSCFVMAVISTIIFIRVEFKVEHPLIPFHAFTNRGFLIGVLIFIATLGFSWTVTFFAPLYLQTVMNFSTSKTGWVFLIMTVMTFVIPGFSGLIYDKHGRSLSACLVLVAAILSFALMFLFKIDGPLWLVILTFLAYGSAWGAANGVAMPIALSEQKNQNDTGVISGAVCTIFNFFGILFFSLVGILFASTQAISKSEFVHAFHATALIMLCLTVVFSVIVGYVLKRPR